MQKMAKRSKADQVKSPTLKIKNKNTSLGKALMEAVSDKDKVVDGRQSLKLVATEAMAKELGIGEITLKGYY